MSKAKIQPWRRIKHSDPEKLKVLEEDFVRPRRRRASVIRPILLGLVIPIAAGVGYSADTWSLDSVGAMLPASGCDIKGNVSINSRERIYHVPGQKHYHETRISPEHGERWFCSEADARQAGWRKSRI